MAVEELCADPVTVMLFGRLICRASTAERVKHDITWIGREENGTLGDYQFQLVDSRSDLEFAMTVRRCVFPEVAEIETCGIQFVPMAPVILQLACAVSASRHRQPQFIKRLCLTTCVVKKRVMRRIKFSAARI